MFYLFALLALWYTEILNFSEDLWTCVSSIRLVCLLFR